MNLILKDNFKKRLITYILSLVVLTFSTSLFIHVKHIGIAPIDVFFVVLGQMLHQKIGNIILLINVIFWLFQLVTYFVKKKSELNIYYFLQLIPTLFFGQLVNLHSSYIELLNFDNIAVNISAFIISFIVMCFAIGLMICSDIIRNPYAGFNFAIITLSNDKWLFKYIRLVNDFLWVVVAIVMIVLITHNFSPLNLGSILFVVASGPLCSMFAKKSNKILKFNNEFDKNL